MSLSRVSSSDPIKCWLDVIDVATGEPFPGLITEADTLAGWVKVVRRHPDGRISVNPEKSAVIDTINGKFKLQLIEDAPNWAREQFEAGS